MRTNNSDPKISKKMLKIGIVLLIIGIAVVVIGIVMTVNGVKASQEEYDRKMAEYRDAYATWSEQWMDGLADLSDKPEMPNSEVGSSFGNIFIIVIGAPIAFAGIALTIFGARPYLAKFAAKTGKETLDYVGEDISAVGVKAVEVVEPVIEKGSEVIGPAIGNIVGDIAKGIKQATKDTNSEPTKASPASKTSSSTSARRFCGYCGYKVTEKHRFCPNCGERME